MRISLIKIGNSMGVRLPASVIKQCGFEDTLNLEVKNKTVLISAADGIRYGWEELTYQENQDKPFDEKGEWEW